MDKLETVLDSPTLLRSEWPDFGNDLRELLTAGDFKETQLTDWIGEKSHALPRGIVLLTMLTPESLEELRHHPHLGDILTALYNEDEG